MLTLVPRRLAVAMFSFAILALFLSLGDAADAAKKKYVITSTKQIKPKVLKQLRGASGLAGANGAPGPQGAAGPPGPAASPAAPAPTYSAGAGLALSNGAFSIANGGVTGSMLGFPLSASSTDAQLASPLLSLIGATNGSIPDPPSAAMLHVVHANSSSVGPAIYGKTNSIFGNPFTAGVAGETSGTGGYGVYANASATSGSGVALGVLNKGQGRAASITSSNPSNTQPVLVVSNLGSGFAAELDGSVKVAGNLNVTGVITGAAKNFKIDDPTAPRRRYLVHTAVESPHAVNIYDGNVTTDARGFATVRLPRYFSAANTDPRYQLTVIGSFAQAVVWKPERDNRFVVRTSRPRVRVSWQVTGIRNDPYARTHRFPAQQPKPAAERGRYLHPGAYGRRASQE